MAADNMGLITVSPDEEEKYRKTPLLDVKKILEEGRETKTLVFEPQGYKVKIKRPALIALQEVKSNHKELLDSCEDLRLQLTGLSDKPQKEWTEEERSLAIEWMEKTIPYQMDVLNLVIIDPVMTLSELEEWMALLAKNQLAALYKATGELTSPPKDKEISEIKNF